MSDKVTVGWAAMNGARGSREVVIAPEKIFNSFQPDGSMNFGDLFGVISYPVFIYQQASELSGYLCFLGSKLSFVYWDDDGWPILVNASTVNISD